VFELGVPILGICYGQQVMMQMLGGEVCAATAPRNSAAPMWTHRGADRPADGLVPRRARTGLDEPWRPREPHRPGLRGLRHLARRALAITADHARNFYAVQFHPEVHHTPNGKTLYENFVKLAGFTGDWTMGAYRDEAIRKIREQVGDAEGDLRPVGRRRQLRRRRPDPRGHRRSADLRLRRSRALAAERGRRGRGMFRDHYNIPLIHADESELFPGRAGGRPTPRQSARSSAAVHRRVPEIRRRDRGRGVPGPGHALPRRDRIVSFSGGPSVTIKSHHNVGGLPEKMGLKLVEPLRELFKDEVRALGRELGLPASFIGRHPFPGPGLAIRCPGEITREKLDILRKADAVYIDQIRRTGSTTRSGRPSSRSCRCAPWA
jgi:GMP synthase (glutamine-hydrolysing)